MRTDIITIGDKKIQVYIPEHSEEYVEGLSILDSLDYNHGMLFIFDKEEPQHFNMNCMKFPIDIAFFDKKFNIVDFVQLDLNQEYSSKPAMYAIETNKGWFKKEIYRLYPG